MSYADRLKAIQKSWGNTKAHTGGGGALPAGKYQVEIALAQLEESPFEFNKGNPQIAYTMKVAIGPMKGRTAKKWTDLAQPATDRFPSGLAIWKGELSNLGLDLPKSLDDKSIKNICKQLIGIQANISIVERPNGKTTTYINSAVNAPKDEEDNESEEEEENIEEEESEDSESDNEEPEDDDDDNEEEEVVIKATKKAAGKKKAASDDDEWELD